MDARTARPAGILMLVLLPLVGCDDEPENPMGPLVLQPASIEVTPDRVAIEVGDTVQFTAVVRDASGNELPNAQVEWSTTNTAVGQVNATGLLTAVGAGSIAVIARAVGTTVATQSGVTVVLEGEIVISDRAVVVDSTSWVLLSDSTERATGIYRFEITGPGGLTRGPTDTTALREGDFIVGGQGNGYLREVATISRSGDIVTLETTQAALPDVVEKGDFLHDFDLDDPEGVSNGTLRLGASTLTPLADGVEATARGVRFDGLEFDLIEKCKETSKTKVEICFTVTPQIKTGELSFKSNFNLGGATSRGSTTNFETGAVGTLVADADLAVTFKLQASKGGSKDYEYPNNGDSIVTDADGDGERDLDRVADKEIAQSGKPFSFLIGYLPVFGRVLTNFSVKIDVVLAAETSFSKRFHLEYPVAPAINWNGSSWSNNDRPVQSVTFEHHPFEWDGVKGTAEAKLSLVPELNIELYGVAGPYIQLEPYAKATGVINVPDLDGNAQLRFGVDLNVGVKTNDDIKDLLGIGAEYEVLGIPLFDRKAAEIFFKNPVDVIVSTTSTNGDPDAISNRGYRAFMSPEHTDSVDAPFLNIVDLDLGCRNDPGAPGPNRILGNTVCDRERELTRPTDSVSFPDVRAGLSHRLELNKGGADNCSWVGRSEADPYEREVEDLLTVKGGRDERERMEYRLECIPWGKLEVTVLAAGDPLDFPPEFVLYEGRDKYEPPYNWFDFDNALSSEDIRGGPIPPGATRTFDAIFGTFALLEVPANCDVAPDPRRSLAWYDSVYVASEQTVQLQFLVGCSPLTDFSITTSVTCDPVGEPCFLDEDDYELSLLQPAIPDVNGWQGGSNRQPAPKYTPSRFDRMTIGIEDTARLEHRHGHRDYEVTLSDVARSCRAENLQNDHGNLSTWSGNVRLGTQADGSDSTFSARVVCNGYPVQNLQVKALSDTSVHLSWNRTPPSEVSMVGYRVYRDGQLMPGVVPFGAEEFPQTDTLVDYDLTPETAYEYRVAYQAADGRIGARSAPKQVTTLETPDLTPPTIPTGLDTTHVGVTEVDLIWGASTDPESGVTGYVLFRDGAERARTSDTVYTDMLLTAETTYAYTLIALNGGGVPSDTAGPLSVTTDPDSTGPTMVTGLRVVGATPTSVQLRWSAAQDSESGVAGYVVSRDGIVVDTVGALTFTDTAVSPDSQFVYTVAALNGQGLLGLPSAPVTASTPAVPRVPAAPTNLTAVAVSHALVQVTWTDNANNEDDFSIERSLDGVNWSQYATTGVNTQVFTDTSVNPSTPYWYRVRARNAFGFSPYSNTASVTTPAAPTAPVAPTSLTAAFQAPNGVLLDWTDNATNETDYRVERSDDQGTTWAQIASLGADVATYVDAPVPGNATLSYRVRACNPVGCSAYSNSAAVATPDDTPPTAPTGLNSPDQGPALIAIVWQAAADPESGIDRYIVYRDGTKVDSTSATQFVDQGLASGTTYVYEVAAVNGAGLEGPRSAPLTETTGTDDSMLELAFVQMPSTQDGPAAPQRRGQARHERSVARSAMIRSALPRASASIRGGPR